MNSTWRWISKPALMMLHDESLAEHGGAEGVRDDGLLDSALARPLNIVAYSDAAEPPDVATLAASYGVGLAKNHAFVDGNKRAAFLAVGLFLALNGWRLQCTQADATLTLLAVASGEVSEDDFANWLRAHTTSRM
ncbi:type II toxin-antitoxin system death-on-curing family toxin [Rhodoferax sp.]|uniref:type II toxin-antitoxin system death-on-curing family toxin n=1 Tax=Rhodoferax sp. TaxID=50421 RepID=UPI002723168A|nr:type II toxin-antitoxin system death-on-curing family toxin [Rhodoferax sp.]MDO8321076.1 type II toxin-antitoxin system death-on-curing family toxin [Rhodoferax sp.]MDP2679525.1 type II toxin-antitoxin system death-on-curing family toxin [Rhodoferax sp.]